MEHWADIRASDAMSNVWQQIRVGRHPGFEEGLAPLILHAFDLGSLTVFMSVWPVIAQNLEFKRSANVAGDGRESSGGAV